MRLLGVETSSPIFSVAIFEGGRVLSSVRIEGTGRPSALLADLIQQAAASAGLGLKELDGFAVSIGPGSFTGLRVGVMTVKTLAWALKKPVLPVSSLEVIAQNLKSFPQPVGLFLDARKAKVYGALFSPNGPGRLKRLTEDRLMPPEEALRGFPDRTILVGDGLKRYGELARSLRGETVSFAPEESGIPSAESLCLLAAERWPAGKVDDPHRLVPKYLYSLESDITGH